ncbi:unnamed protein product [Clavelina lepadiformis]|uniref:Large ribosomal subunit protein mL49 n=1 Tax=Clavelina lepadiformis TaxID=159417 RepID=A0ABP0GVM1_CLALP
MLLLVKQHLNRSQTRLTSVLTSNNSGVAYTISKEEFKWIRRLLPPSIIPKPPLHSNYPTPSGWSPPTETSLDLPYFISRTRYHEFPVYEITKRNGQTMTHIRKIEGDIWAFERDLIGIIHPYLDFDPATRVHEVAGIVSVKGNFKAVITQYLREKGF